MKFTDTKVGDWIIWDGDTYPTPRKIVEKKERGLYTNDLQFYDRPYNIKSNKYEKISELITPSQIKLARLCREDEISKEFKIQHYELY